MWATKDAKKKKNGGIMQDKGDSPTEIFQIAQGRKDSASQTNNLQTWKESLTGKQASKISEPMNINQEESENMLKQETTFHL